MRSQAYVAVLALSLSLAALAQAPAPQPERRTFAVSVLDKDGKAIHGLTAANFRGAFRGQPVKILSATEDSSPRRIAIPIDRSASMRMDPDLVEFIWATVHRMIESSAPPHKLVLLTFSDSLAQHSELTEDRAALLRGLEKAQDTRVRGSTALFDALARTSKAFAPARPSDAIVVLSDGLENASGRGNWAAERNLAALGIRVYFVWPLRPRDTRHPPLVLTIAKQDMIRLGDVTGGLLLELQEYRPEDAAPVVARISDALCTGYLIEVQFPAAIDKPREWKLELVDAEQKPLKDHRVAYPRLLVPQRPE